MADVVVYAMRDYDEKPWFEQFAKELGLTIKLTTERPTMDNLQFADGCTCLNITTNEITAPMAEELYRRGVRFISTRTIGYDHIDMEAARRLGLGVGNASYGPDGVADYTIMLMLMTLRKLKAVLARANAQDFTLKGIQGCTLSEMTVGVIGTGRIGRAVIQRLHGFGCRVLAYDPFENDSVRALADYVPLNTLLAQSDIISLHAPLIKENHHLIGREGIAKMKDGALIINTARGGLIDSEALIEVLVSGKLGGAGLDVVENEFGLYHYDLRGVPLDNRELHILKGLPNVIVTPHVAFYTEDAVRDMVGLSLRSCRSFLDGTDDPMRVL